MSTLTSWSLLRDAEYDDTVSRTNDRWGSFGLLTPVPERSMALSDLIPV